MKKVSPSIIVEISCEFLTTSIEISNTSPSCDINLTFDILSFFLNLKKLFQN